MPDTIRSYISIELSTEVKTALVRLQSRLKKVVPSQIVRWSDPDNVHLTLHFLGEITPTDFITLDQALKGMPLPYLPFSLALGGLGCFPNLRRPRVIWVGLQDDNLNLLTRLHREIEALLKETIGFKPEDRPYSPHLTLGRVKPASSQQVTQLGQVLQQEQGKVGQIATLEVNEIHLMKSKLNQGRNIDWPT